MPFQESWGAVHIGYSGKLIINYQQGGIVKINSVTAETHSFRIKIEFGFISLRNELC